MASKSYEKSWSSVLEGTDRPIIDIEEVQESKTNWIL